MSFRLFFPQLDINIEHENKDFLIQLIDAIKNNSFQLQELEWVSKPINETISLEEEEIYDSTENPLPHPRYYRD